MAGLCRHARVAADVLLAPPARPPWQGNIRVFARVRPGSEGEAAEAAPGRPVIAFPTAGDLAGRGLELVQPAGAGAKGGGEAQAHSFGFDRVFAPTASQVGGRAPHGLLAWRTQRGRASVPYAALRRWPPSQEATQLTRQPPAPLPASLAITNRPRCLRRSASWCSRRWTATRSASLPTDRPARVRPAACDLGHQAHAVGVERRRAAAGGQRVVHTNPSSVLCRSSHIHAAPAHALPLLPSSSGKTHTMMGSPQEPGMIPRAMDQARLMILVWRVQSLQGSSARTAGAGRPPPSAPAAAALLLCSERCCPAALLRALPPCCSTPAAGVCGRQGAGGAGLAV